MIFSLESASIYLTRSFDGDWHLLFFLGYSATHQREITFFWWTRSQITPKYTQNNIRLYIKLIIKINGNVLKSR